MTEIQLQTAESDSKPAPAPITVSDHIATVRRAGSSTARLSDSQEEIAYRPIARSAVVACLLGIVSLLAFLDHSLAVIPALGILSGVLALWRIRAQPDYLTGEGLAMIGVVLSVACWAGGWGWLAWVQMTEVPEGYRVITYDELQPDPKAPEQLAEFAQSLEGQKVFVKGYMYPGRQSRGITEFVLCYNNDDCCFGGAPKQTHMIRVTLPPGATVNYSKQVRKVAGVFHVRPGSAADGALSAIYHIDAEEMK